METNRDTFDRIAESWYRVRHWPLLREELKQLAERWSGSGQPAQRWSGREQTAERGAGDEQAAQRGAGDEQAAQRGLGGEAAAQRGLGGEAAAQRRLESEQAAQRGPGGRLLNVGCAHGADFLLFQRDSGPQAPHSYPKIPKRAQKDSTTFELWGMDFAPRMLEQAQRYSAKFGFYVNLVVADMLALPYGDSTFDFAVAVAAYHHIQGRKHRATAVKELARVLKPGGEAFLSVWNRAQPRFWLRSQEQLVPWRLGATTVQRYYHLFSYGEIRKLLAEAEFEIIYLGPEGSYRFPVRSFSRNICALVRKRSRGERSGQ